MTRLDENNASQVICDVVSPHSALSARGIDGQLFTQLQSITPTKIEREMFSRGMAACWGKIDDEPGAFPPEF